MDLHHKPATGLAVIVWFLFKAKISGPTAVRVAEDYAEIPGADVIDHHDRAVAIYD
jgi:hypothetical protein